MYLILYIFLCLIIIIYILNSTKKVIIIDNLKHIPKYIKNPIVLVICSVHGNEPAGYLACKNMLINLNRYHVNGTLLFYSNPNPSGIRNNSRFQEGTNVNLKDINRNFINGGLDKVSKQIIKFAKISDLIIDLHEGWGYHIQNKSSVGSTIITDTKKSSIKQIGKEVVRFINTKIKDDNKKFVFISKLKPNKHIQHTLRDWCRNNNKDYMLIETSGQGDIQPISIRINQQELIVYKILQLFNLVIYKF